MSRTTEIMPSWGRTCHDYPIVANFWKCRIPKKNQKNIQDDFWTIIQPSDGKHDGCKLSFRRSQHHHNHRKKDSRKRKERKSSHRSNRIKKRNKKSHHSNRSKGDKKKSHCSNEENNASHRFNRIEENEPQLSTYESKEDENKSRHFLEEENKVSHRPDEIKESEPQLYTHESKRNGKKSAKVPKIASTVKVEYFDDLFDVIVIHPKKKVKKAKLTLLPLPEAPKVVEPEDNQSAVAVIEAIEVAQAREFNAFLPNTVPNGMMDEDWDDLDILVIGISDDEELPLP